MNGPDEARGVPKHWLPLTGSRGVCYVMSAFGQKRTYNRLHAELLNEEVLQNMKEAQVVLEAWRQQHSGQLKALDRVDDRARLPSTR